MTEQARDIPKMIESANRIARLFAHTVTEPVQKQAAKPYRARAQPQVQSPRRSLIKDHELLRLETNSQTLYPNTVWPGYRA